MTRIHGLLMAVVAVLAIALGSSGVTAQAPGPSAGTKLTGDLREPRGMKLGPDGMIYIAEAGNAGTTAVGTGDNASMSGNTGRISKIDPATGTRTTVADNLPSNGGMEGNVGPADVAFIGNQLYYVQTHGGAAFGFPNNPTGVYKVNTNGTVTLVADIGKFNIANPVTDVSSGAQQDIEPGGNPYSMTVRDGAFLVVDGNQNQVMKITTAGAITRIAQFPGHPVTTGITFAAGGPLYVSALGQFPFSPADGIVYQVGYPSGSVTKIASGFSAVTDVELSPGGQLYALTFADQATDPNGPPLLPFSGKVLRVNSDGTMTIIVDRFTFATNMIFIGDTLYVTNNGISALGPGEIWKIADFSTITPIPIGPPTPAAPLPPAPPSPVPAGAPSGISAPNTGTGDSSGDVARRPWTLVLALGVIGIAAVGGAVAMKRR